MTFRVIEGGGGATLEPASTIEEARSEIIDRVAGAIYAADDPLPEYMNWASFLALAPDRPYVAYEVAKYRRQARLAIAAMKCAGPPEAEFVILGQQDIDPLDQAEASTVWDRYIDEVLK